ncbi:hypothetical protein C0Q70_10601 [Pomacea canaliculata]|uniref:Uncharacterized protein n=1 Tax=Pomacea canaliculata TaxID=400727 RepID=A0A2T7P3N0_POMCA|nr:hypothetical protein C0Q70_10601 [Pomacea canaliculata]
MGEQVRAKVSNGSHTGWFEEYFHQVARLCSGHLTLGRVGGENDVKKTNCRHCGWCVGESGGIGFTPHTQPGVLFSGIMSRTHSVHANFSRVFATKPWVSVGITHLDVFNNANVRIDDAMHMEIHCGALPLCRLVGVGPSEASTSSTSSTR